MIRELNEELGAIVTEIDVTFIGSITEDFTNHKHLVNVYFWHDKLGSITGCYEWESVQFDTIEDAISQPEIMDYAVWSLKKCQELKLINHL
jgi:8-oxo-dGTP diphosphatase